MSVEAVSSESLTGGCAFRRAELPFVADKLMLVVGWGPQFLTVCLSPKGCMSVLTAWQLASPRAHDLIKNKAEAMCFL